VESRPAADAVDRNAINQVSSLLDNPCADVAGKEAEVCGGDGGEAEPADLVRDFEEHAFGREREWFGGEREVGPVEEDGSRVAVEINENGSLVVSHNNGLGDMIDSNGFFPVMSVVHDMCGSGNAGYVVVLGIRNEEAGAGASGCRNADDGRLDNFNGI